MIESSASALWFRGLCQCLSGWATIVSRLAFALSAGLLVGACSIHPLPEDTTRHTTIEIVQKIRCEARDALDQITVELMRESRDPLTISIANEIEAGRLTAVEAFERNYKRLDRNIVELANLFTTSAVGFGFTFTMTENDDVDGAANFRLPTPASVFTLGFDGWKKLKRSNARKFNMATTFFDLHGEVKREDCVQISAKSGNFVYPISGQIGLSEVFRTFMRLHLIKGLSIAEVKTDTDRFSDTLTFTTDVKAGVHPKITLTPGPLRSFRLSDVSVNVNVGRIDEHKVIVSLARGARFTSFAEARAEAKKRALMIINDVRTEDFFVRQNDIFRRLEALP